MSYGDLKQQVKSYRQQNGEPEAERPYKSYGELKRKVRQRRFLEDVRNVDQDYIKLFESSASDFFSSAQGDIGWDNAISLYQDSQKTMKDLDYKRSVITSWLASNRDSLDPGYYKSLLESMNIFSNDSRKIMSALSEAKDYYDPEKNQEAYLQYVDHQNKMGYDLGAGQKKIDDLTRAMELAKAMKKDGYSDPSANRHAQREYQRILENYGLTSEDDLKELISAETVMFNQSKWTQQEAEMASVVDSPDFMQYSQMGAGMQNPSYEDATGWGYLFGWRPGADDVQNKVTFARDNAEALAKEKENRNGNSGIPAVVDPLYRHVTEEEAAIYSYYLAKDGAEKAEEYLQSLRDKLNQREAAEEYARIQGRTGLEVLYGVTVGADQFRSGMSSLFDDSDYIAPSAIQYAGQAARQDLEDNGPKILGSSLGQIGYDALSTTANMAPSILASMAVGMVSKTAGAAVGNALMGASAAGNAYAEKLNAGYSKEQARTYGLMVGASEIAMEKLLGGITALGGGTLSKMAIKGLDKVDNVLSRVAKSAGGKILMNAGSEALEEGLQSILEPYIWQAVSGEEANVDWEEALYSSLLGFVTGGVFEGGNTIAESSVQRANRNAEALELYGPDQEALVTEGLELDPDSKFAQRMQSRLDRGKDLTGGQLYKLGQHNEAAMVKNDISAIQKAAESALTNYGETGDVKAISEALAKQAAGKKLSKAERTAISESKYGRRVANELNPKNIQSGDFNTTWAESIGTKRINAEEYGRLVADAEADLSGAEFSPAAVGSTADASEASATANLTGVDSTISEEVSDSTVEADTSVSLEEASRKYGAQAKAMVATYDPGQDVASFDRAYGVAYEMGKSGVSMDYAVNSSATSYLTQTQRELAYRQGTFAATNKAKSVDAVFKGKGSTEGGRRKGAVKLEGIKASEFRKMLKDSNDPRGKAVKALMTIAEVTGVDIVLFKSRVDASGRYVGEQGRFEWKNDTIYIDVNAGLSYGSDAGELTKYAMLRTFGHEFTHFLEKNAASQYSEFRKLVFAEMTKAGTNVDYLIQRKQAQYKEQGLSYEAASREVVAESMGDILRDSNFVETLAQKHNSLFKTLLDQFKRFIRNIRSYFNSIASNTSPEAKALKEEINGTLKYMDSIVEAFDKMAVEAVENYQARMAESDGIVAELTPGQEGVVVDKDGEPVAYSTEDGTVMLSIRTYEEEGRSAFRAYLEKCVTSKKLTKTEMTEMLDGIEEIYTVCKEFKDKYAPFSAWSDAEVIRDTKGKPVFSVVTPNGEYKMNLDFSLVCKKRRALDAVLNEMSKRGIIDDFELGKKTIVKINELIRKHGFETACALCFVDAKRFRQADVADSMVKLYNDLVMSLVPEGSVDQIEHFNFAGVRTKTAVENGIHTWSNSELDFTHINEVLEQYGKDTVEAKAARYIKNNPKGRRLLQRGDFMSSGGFDAVKSQNQDIMSLYNSKKGTGGPKAAFGDVQYLNEVISKARWWTPKKAYEVGGVRVQSFSDYVPRMVFDYVQMIYDLAATKLPAHAYTKEALFVKQFGKTGIKINMSLIPAVVEDGIAPGLDANGDYVWAGESFDYDTAVEIQRKPGYTENCGTICVGVSYEHILKLLGDRNIRMVIPYHKSGLNPVVAHMNKVDKFVDYTSLKSNPGGCQNTMDAEGKKVEKDFNFNETLRKSGDPRAAADAYLKWCDDHGYTPKFAEFRKEANYYKLLIDFTVYDEFGNYVPQREVRAVFPKEGDAFGAMKDLIESGLKEDAKVQGARDEKISEIVDEIEETIARKEDDIPNDEQVEQADRDLEADLLYEDRDASYDSYVQHSARVYDEDTLEFLNGQETIKTYKTMQIVDGKLYPPMAARTKGQYEDHSILGTWEQATEHPELITKDGKYKLDKGKGQGSIEAAYNPYMHSSDLPINDQFTSAYKRDNLVTVECEVPVSEMSSGYHAQYAKDSVGWHSWHTGTVAGAIRKARGVERRVFLSRWIKPVRIVPDSEVASMYKELIADADIAIPDNVVTPSLLSELKNIGVNIAESGKVQYQARDYSKATKNTTNEGGVPKNMKKISINRNIIPYEDKAEQWAVIDRKAVDLESRGKVINLTSENVLKYKDAVRWKDKKAVREFLRSVLASDHGVSVYFEYDGQLAIAYLTSHGIKHAVGGYASPRKAAAFEAFRELVKNAEYTFSSLHDEHSEIGKNLPGETIWDFFVSVAMIDGKPYPVAFKLRTTDSDVRSQIYEMYQTKEDGVFHGAGKQESADGHPIYESIPSSDGTITQENGDVKDDVQNQLRTNTLTDHEILDMAAKELDTSKLTDGEKAALDIFRKKVTALKALKEERQKQGSLYYEAQFGENRDKAKASAARNRMSVLDSQITRASAEVLSLEDKKVLKDVLQKSRKVIEQHEREKASERVQNVREGYKSSRLREKIRAFKSKLEKNLLQPTERQYVPAGLTQAMIDVVSLIDIDTDLINEDGTVNKAQERRDETKMKLSDLAVEYERLKASDPVYAGEFDEVVYTYLTELRDNFTGRHLSEMTFDELTEMYEILRSIEETLQDARKLIGWGDAEGIYEAGDAIIGEQDAITSKRKDGKRTNAEVRRDKTLALTLSPMRYVERMSGYDQDSYLYRLFKALERGVRKKNQFRMGAYKTFEALTSRQQYEDAIYNPVGKAYTDSNGRSFRLSKMQMMQAILSMEREQANNMSHIEGSGFSFADLEMLKKGRLRDAISEEYSHRVPNAAMMVGEFVELLRNDRWAQDYMDAARKFFNETAKDAVNETGMALKHRIIAKDKSYIPFEVDRNFIVNEISAANDVQQTINSYGMLKDTKKFASNPLIITGLNNILDRHIEQVGNLYGLAIEIRNFNKVWNTKGMDAGNGDPTVKAAIQRNWGNEGAKLVEQAVQDIQGPRQNTQSDLYKKVKSGYIGATFLLNLSVVTKQVGSLFSANSMLRMRGPVSQIINLVSTMANSKRLSAEVDRYTASAWMRRQGLSDAEVYTLMTEGKRTVVGRLMDKAPTAVNPTKWITGMDHAVALSLWKYAKEDTANRTGLKGEALLQAAAEFYDEVIENTQSMTDALHRPEIQKRSDILSEAFGMFKTDLYQMAGQLLVAKERYRANKSKENKKALGRTVYSVAMSAVWAQLMTAVFAMIRYKVNPYRDDEDKDLTVESWMKRQGFALAGDLAGYIFPLLGSELVGFVENIVYDETEDIVDSLALTAINDLWDSATTIGSSLKEGELPSISDMRKITAKALQVCGIPSNNILRIVEAIQLHAKDVANGKFLSFEAGVKRTANHHAHRIMEAVEKGNMELAKVLFEEAVGQAALQDTKDGAVTDEALKKARSSLQSAVGKKFRDGEMSREIADTILTDLFGMDDDDVFWLLKEWNTGLSSNYSSVFDAVQKGSGFDGAFDEMVSHGYADEDIYSQIKTQIGKWYTSPDSDVRISKEQAIDMLRKYTDMEETDISKTVLEWTCQVVTGIRYDDIMTSFLNGQISEARAAEMYVKYGGYGKEDAVTKVRNGKWRYEHPVQKDLSDSAIDRYLKYCKPAGVSAETFHKAKKFTSDIESDGSSGSIKRQYLEYIYSLGLPYEQQRALWYALKKTGWSDSDTPF